MTPLIKQPVNLLKEAVSWSIERVELVANLEEYLTCGSTRQESPDCAAIVSTANGLDGSYSMNLMLL
jgi:hypothetical protein